MRVLTAEQMGYVDRTTIERGTPGLTLMRNAGSAVFDAVKGIPGIDAGTEIVVVAGKGNNGGDGFRTAELLAESGFPVSVFLVGRTSDVRGDAASCMAAAVGTGVKIVEITDESGLGLLVSELADAGVVVDAVFGTGLKGEVTGLPASVMDSINECGAVVVSVDVPSGLNADTGGMSRHSVRADYTVTFGALKVCHVMMPGRSACGEVSVVDIGFSDEIMDSVEPFGYALTADEAAELIPLRPYDMHKGTAGRVLFVAGSVGLTGAAAMSSTAALRVGAGLVTVGGPASLNDILEVKLTEVMTVPLPEVRKKRCLSLRALGKIREHARKADVAAVGPGVGTYFETRELVKRFVSGFPGKVVLDADGINSYGGEAPSLKSAPGEIVLTPHPGELSTLTGVPTAGITGDPVSAAREASEETGCIVLLKGASTVIADPSGTVWINATGNSGMATAGMGDVLTGTIAGFAAQGLGVRDAAVLGAYLHGLAGDMVLTRKGPHGMTAGDVLETLPEAILNILRHAE